MLSGNSKAFFMFFSGFEVEIVCSSVNEDEAVSFQDGLFDRVFGEMSI